MDLFPILGPGYTKSHFVSLDLSLAHLISQGREELHQVESYILNATDHFRLIPYGGYLEHRGPYQSTLFINKRAPIRDIHLGVDFWTQEGAPVYAPLDGTIHSFAYNGNHLDYGYTLILQHFWEGQTIYALYGHLSGAYMNQWVKGMQIEKGMQIANVGGRTENGGWLPHLHFQLIRDLEEKFGDYPGVCAQVDLNYYVSNCPDPSILCATK